MIHPRHHVASVRFFHGNVPSFLKLFFNNILHKIVPHLIVLPVLGMQLTKDLVSLRVIHQLLIQNFIMGVGKLLYKSQLAERQVFDRLNRKIKVFVSEDKDCLQTHEFKILFSTKVFCDVVAACF
jgi:hypothetical protein